MKIFKKKLKFFEDEVLRLEEENKFLKEENSNLRAIYEMDFQKLRDSEKQINVYKRQVKKLTARYFTQEDIINALQDGVKPEEIAEFTDPDFHVLNNSDKAAGTIHFYYSDEIIDYSEQKLLEEFKHTLDCQGPNSCSYKVYDGHMELDYQMMKWLVGEYGDDYTFADYLAENKNKLIQWGNKK